jgi:hypothetical protein
MSFTQIHGIRVCQSKEVGFQVENNCRQKCVLDEVTMVLSTVQSNSSRTLPVIQHQESQTMSYSTLMSSGFEIWILMFCSMCTSDLYYANDSLNKRQWEYVVGLFALISVIVPSFGHFRVGAIVGVSSTTITGLYLFVASLVHGQVISCVLKLTIPLIHSMSRCTSVHQKFHQKICNSRESL